jgi:hypothetical protein
VIPDSACPRNQLLFAIHNLLHPTRQGPATYEVHIVAYGAVLEVHKHVQVAAAKACE